MFPSKRFLGYKTSGYTKAVWVMAQVPLWGSLVLFSFGTKWGVTSLILGILLSGVFLYCASVDHKRWCPVHGTEKEEKEEVPSSEDNPGV